VKTKNILIKDIKNYDWIAGPGGGSTQGWGEIKRGWGNSR